MKPSILVPALVLSILLTPAIGRSHPPAAGEKPGQSDKAGQMDARPAPGPVAATPAPPAVADEEGDAPETTVQPAVVPPAGPFTLRVIHINDPESQVENAGRGREEFGGAARSISLIQKLQAEEKAAAEASPGGDIIITISGGDNYEPGGVLAASLANGVSYDAMVLKHANLDASAVGNHEFDIGPDLLARFIKSFPEETKFISANLDVSREPILHELFEQERLQPSMVVSRDGQRVGIVASTTHLLQSLSSPRDVRAILDAAPLVQSEIDKLEAQGVTTVILIAHMQGLGEDARLVGKLRGVDLVVSGGGHELLAATGDLLLPGDEARVAGPYPTYLLDADGKQVPAVTTPGEYRYVGRFVAKVDAAGKIESVDEARSAPYRVASTQHPDGVEPSAIVVTEVLEPVRTHIAPMGATVIATLQVPLDGRRATLRSAESNEANLLADAMLWKARAMAPGAGAPVPVAALLNGGSIRHDSRLVRGQRLTRLDLLNATPFANVLVVVPDMPPARLKEILENAVSKTEEADGRFLHFAGMKMRWNSAALPRQHAPDGKLLAPGNRILEVALNDGTMLVSDGKVVSDKPITIVATDFLHRGGDQHPFEGLTGLALPVTTQQALEDYLTTVLLGNVTADKYPPGGEGRITRMR